LGRAALAHLAGVIFPIAAVQNDAEVSRLVAVNRDDGSRIEATLREPKSSDFADLDGPSEELTGSEVHSHRLGIPNR
jgi:hypothetical protein